MTEDIKEDKKKVNSSNLGMCFKLAHSELDEKYFKDDRYLILRTKELYKTYNKIKKELENEIE